MKQYIIQSICNNYPTETFWNNKEKASKILDTLNETGCGSNCTNAHKLITIDTSRPRVEGKIYLPEDNEYY